MPIISMQPPQPEQDQRVRARDWFASGVRRLCDSDRHLQVFEKVVAPRPVSADTRWLTMLPGYPDGSYGYAQVDQHLGSAATPRLYVEYLGQGDSDKPARHRYSTIERADLVEAQWRAHGIRRTMVVTFDYSSLVLLELLRRQQEAADASGTTIDAVFIVNGGLFADVHSHPWSTTPMLKTPLGGLYMRVAQRAPRVFDRTLRNAGLFPGRIRFPRTRSQNSEMRCPAATAPSSSIAGRGSLTNIVAMSRDGIWRRLCASSTTRCLPDRRQ